MLRLFNIDAEKLIRRSTPQVKRSERFLDYLYTIASCFQVVFDRLFNFQSKTKYSLQFNFQTHYLEHILNDKFDTNGRGIYIDNTPTHNSTFIFNKAENRPDNYFYNRSEQDVYLRNGYESFSKIDFVVNVPVGVVYSDAAISAVVKKYKLVGKCFIIKRF